MFRVDALEEVNVGPTRQYLRESVDLLPGGVPFRVEGQDAILAQIEVFVLLFHL